MAHNTPSKCNPKTPASRFLPVTPGSQSPLYREDDRPGSTTCHAKTGGIHSLRKCGNKLSSSARNAKTPGRAALLASVEISQLYAASCSPNFSLPEDLVPGLFCETHNRPGQTHVEDFITEQRRRLAGVRSDGKRSVAQDFHWVDITKNKSKQMQNPQKHRHSYGLTRAAAQQGSDIESLFDRVGTLDTATIVCEDLDSPLNKHSETRKKMHTKSGHSRNTSKVGSGVQVQMSEVKSPVNAHQHSSQYRPNTSSTVASDKSELVRISAKFKSGFFRQLCCLGLPQIDEDELELVMRRRKAQAKHQASTHNDSHYRDEKVFKYNNRNIPRPQVQTNGHVAQLRSGLPRSPLRSQRPQEMVSIPPRESKHRETYAVVSPITANLTESPTEHFDSIIPNSLPTNLQNRLKVLLGRGPFEGDGEGYIYVYWLTLKTDDAKPGHKIASTLMNQYVDSPAHMARLHNHPVTGYSNSQKSNFGSDETIALDKAIKRHGSVTGFRNHSHADQATNSFDTSPKRTILVKIGFANDVERRMKEWKAQCKYDISLLRSYPYRSSAQKATGECGRFVVPRMMHVEKLIHLELEAQNVSKKTKRDRAAGSPGRRSQPGSPGEIKTEDSEDQEGMCLGCGVKHTEWFEIEATKEGVKHVNEVITRWVNWSIETHTVKNEGYY